MFIVNQKKKKKPYSGFLGASMLNRLNRISDSHVLLKFKVR